MTSQNVDHLAMASIPPDPGPRRGGVAGDPEITDAETLAMTLKRFVFPCSILPTKTLGT